MRAVVVFESMYCNTHTIANAIADGLRESLDVVQVVPVHDADAALEGGVDLLVVGGPTHAHGMSRTTTRDAAIDAADKPDSGLTVDPDARGPGVRDWLSSIKTLETRAAAFDTRIDARAWLTGRASKGIAHELVQHGCTLLEEPESFFVTKDSDLEPGETDRARRWAATLGARVAPTTSTTDAH